MSNKPAFSDSTKEFNHQSRLRFLENCIDEKDSEIEKLKLRIDTEYIKIEISDALRVAETAKLKADAEFMSAIIEGEGKDAEIAEKDERYINMFIQMEKAGVKIIKLEADIEIRNKLIQAVINNGGYSSIPHEFYGLLDEMEM